VWSCPIELSSRPRQPKRRRLNEQEPHDGGDLQLARHDGRAAEYGVEVLVVLALESYVSPFETFQQELTAVTRYAGVGTFRLVVLITAVPADSRHLRRRDHRLDHGRHDEAVGRCTDPQAALHGGGASGVQQVGNTFASPADRRIHAAVKTQMNAGGLKGALLTRAINTKLDNWRKTGEVKHSLYDALVFRKVRRPAYHWCGEG